jgi:hypothetical protein
VCYQREEWQGRQRMRASGDSRRGMERGNGVWTGAMVTLEGLRS